jgi:transposase
MLGAKERVFKSHAELSLEEWVPQDNFYRQVQSKLDLNFVRELVAKCYTPFGRPSIDPVVFFKLHLILFFEGLRSERQLIEMVNLRLDHRWYLGYDLDEAVPDASSLSKIRDRYGVTVFQQFFEQIIELCVKAGLVWGQELYFDASIVEANADYERQVPRLSEQAQALVTDLFGADEELTLQQELLQKYDGSQLVVRKNSYRSQSKERVSLTDPTATAFGQERLGYRLHYGVDGGRSRIILSCLVTPSSIQDNTPMLDLAWWAMFRWQLPLKMIVGDTRYGTIDNVVAVEAQGIQAFFPLHSETAHSRSRQKKFAASLFHYDPEGNYYICPQGQSLPLYNADYQQQRYIYKASAKVCAACPVRSNCTSGKQGRRISHSMFKDVLDRVQAYTQTAAYQKAMRKRAVWVEPRFAEVKVWHQGRRFRLRGLLKVNIEALLKATGQNIKQLLKARTPGKLLQPARAVAILSPFFRDSAPLFPTPTLHSDFFITLHPFSEAWNGPRMGVAKER